MGNLRIGLSNYVSFNYLPAALPEFHKTYLKVSAKLRLGETDELMAMLDRAEGDLSICSIPERHHSIVIKARRHMPPACWFRSATGKVREKLGVEAATD